MGKRKKRKIFQTPEERDAWYAYWEASMERLEWRIRKIRAELEARGPIEGPPLPEMPDWRRRRAS